MTTRPPAPAAAAGEDRSARIAVTVFPALILAAAAFAFFLPDTGQLVAPYTSIFLGIIMFAMGLTLTVPDFTRVAKHPLPIRSEEHTSELQSRFDLVCRLLLEKKKLSHQQILAT